MSYDNTNTGIVSKNDRKQSDNHPDITGKINVDGVDYFLDGWRKERKDGSGSFYSLRVKRMEKQANSGGQREERSSAGSYGDQSGGRPRGGSGSYDMDDQIPFEMCWRG